jgi:hypothetical protein
MERDPNGPQDEERTRRQPQRRPTDDIAGDPADEEYDSELASTGDSLIEDKGLADGDLDLDDIEIEFDDDELDEED